MGIGLDVRPRKIWKTEFKDCTLIDSAVDPTTSNMGLPEGVDFLIGNHSDELTPWIPVMAARSVLLFWNFCFKILNGYAT